MSIQLVFVVLARASTMESTTNDQLTDHHFSLCAGVICANQYWRRQMVVSGGLLSGCQVVRMRILEEETWKKPATAEEEGNDK